MIGHTWHLLMSEMAAIPADLATRNALEDYLLDLGTPDVIAREAHGPLPFSPWGNERVLFLIGSGSGSGRGSGRGSGIGSGSGSGIGRGNGSGIGRGSGSGSGNGSGIGSGIGIGLGRGSGSGSGNGSGSGIAIGSGSGRGSNYMEMGKCYLVHCGDWHTLVGRVVRQNGPFTYILECVSKICETNNGDCWHHLAAGKGDLRRKATYAHYDVPAVVPLNVLAFEWRGKLPQEMD